MNLYLRELRPGDKSNSLLLGKQEYILYIIVDADVAELYGVETKHINEAVKNNPEKFPSGYLLEITHPEKRKLVENFDQFKKLKHSSVPKSKSSGNNLGYY